MSELKDSGSRREFDSGAVRDLAEGKGRCDLLPLGVVAMMLSEKGSKDMIVNSLDMYVRYGIVSALCEAMNIFIERYQVDPYTALLDVSKQYEDGAKKYEERNWEKGIPLHCFIDSAVRHYLKFKRGDTDEPHDRAFMWNIMGAIWTHQNKKNLIDLPFIKTSIKEVVVNEDVGVY